MGFERFQERAVPGRRPVEQPRGRGRSGPLDAAPDEIAPVLGPRQRDVEQAHVFGQPLLPGLLPVLFRDIGPQVAHQLVAVRGIVEEDLLLVILA